jgi:phosphatidylserine/phosphatidylglycerophosphate/cardiolipin synthase-like enzyme
MGRLLAILLTALVVFALGLLQQARQHPPRLLSSDGSAGADFTSTVAGLIDDARERVWVMVYVMRSSGDADDPVRHLITALERAHQRGCDVRVVLDASKKWRSDEIDQKHVDASALLTSLGIPVLVDDLKTRSHSKVVLIDHDLAVIGSHNWTFSALRLNRELSLVVQDARIVADAAGMFLATPGFTEIGGP